VIPSKSLRLCALAAAGLLAAAPALGKGKKGGASSVAGLPKITVHVYDEDGPSVAGDVLSAVAGVVAQDSRVGYRDLGELVDSADEADRVIAGADANLKAATAAFDQMDLENARSKVDDAIKAYERYLPLLGDRDQLDHVRDAWIRLSAIRFFDGNNDGARDALRHVFVYDPKVDYTPQLFLPQMKKAVIEGRLMFDALGPGKIAVESEPPGAVIFLNGSKKGETPFTIEDAPPGPNLLTVVHRGFAPRSANLEIAGGGESVSSELTLARFANDPYAPLGQAHGVVGADVAPAPVLEAMKRVKVDMIVLTRMMPSGDKQKVVCYLYDARSRRLVRQAEKTGPLDTIAETATKAAVELMDRVPVDGLAGMLPPPKEPKVEGPKGPSLFERMGARLSAQWKEWDEYVLFRPLLIGIAATVVVGVALGVGIGVWEHEQRMRQIENDVVLFGSMSRGLSF
jgi:hypothetical protein